MSGERAKYTAGMDHATLATCAKAWQWLKNNPEWTELPDPFDYSNMIVVIETILRVSEEDAASAAEKLRAEGARLFCAAVDANVSEVRCMTPSVTTNEAVKLAYLAERSKIERQ